MQGNLFNGEPLSATPTPDLPLQPLQLRAWQQRIHDHQAALFRGDRATDSQGDLFANASQDPATGLVPMALTPLPLTFWRWPDSPHQGPAIYLVLDRPSDLDQPLLL